MLAVMNAVGLLDGAAEPTARFLERIDNLFDCLNSLKIANPKKFKYAISDNWKHLDILKEALRWIESWWFDSPTPLVAGLS